MTESVAWNPAASLELPSPDARKTQQSQTFFSKLNLGMYGLVLRCFGFSDFRYISTGKAAELSTGYRFFGALPVAHRQPRFLLRFDATGFHLRSLSCRPVVARSAAR
jgi:hypothetical protein